MIDKKYFLDKKIKIKDLIELNNNKNIFLSSEKFSLIEASSVIESILSFFPIGNFYVEIDSTEKFSVIDGNKRLNAILLFLDDKITLNLKFFIRYNNMTFSELPSHVKNRILDTELFFYGIEDTRSQHLKDFFKARAKIK